jgi:hypothetical protein
MSSKFVSDQPKSHPLEVRMLTGSLFLIGRNYPITNFRNFTVVTHVMDQPVYQDPNYVQPQQQFQQPVYQQGQPQPYVQQQFVQPQQQYYQQPVQQPQQTNPEVVVNYGPLVWVEKYSVNPILAVLISLTIFIPIIHFFSYLLAYAYIGQMKKGATLWLMWIALVIVHIVAHLGGPLSLIVFVCRIVHDIFCIMDVYSLASRLSKKIPIASGECGHNAMDLIHTKIIGFSIKPSFVGGTPLTPPEWTQRMTMLGAPTSV